MVVAKLSLKFTNGLECSFAAFTFVYDVQVVGGSLHTSPTQSKRSNLARGKNPSGTRSFRMPQSLQPEYRLAPSVEQDTPEFINKTKAFIRVRDLSLASRGPVNHFTVSRSF